MLNVVRSEFPTQRFHVDIEGSMRLGHMEILCRLDDFSLAMVEQPLPPDDLVGHAMVQETIKTPVSLGRIDHHARAGRDGVGPAQRAVHQPQAGPGRRTDAGPGDPRRSATRTASPAGSARCPNRRSAPASATPWPPSPIAAIRPIISRRTRLLSDDLAPPLLPVRGPGDGKLRIPLWSEPGLGIEPDARVLEKYTIARARV